MTASPLVAVVDYGAGNLRSVAKALTRSELAPEVTADPAAIGRADAVVLPGVGAFADAMACLRAKGLDDAVRGAIASQRPYLGLCLGLQLLCDESDEHGVTAGFGLLPGRVERFAERDATGAPRRVPHIGWNTVRYAGSHPMLAQLPSSDAYYFVHSYFGVPAEPSAVAGTVDYGGEFAACVARDNVVAVQFHPEKSQSAGKRFLDAFAAWVHA